MRYSEDKVVDSVVKRLLKGDWRVKSRNRHMRIENVITKDVITVPTSPSDHRSAKNWLHQIKNSYGVAI